MPQVKVWPSGDFTIGHRLLDRPDNTASPLEGITRDGVGTYYVGRRLPTTAERLIDEYTALETLGRVDECLRVIERLASIPDLPAGFIEGFKERHQGRSPLGLSVVSNSHKPKLLGRKPRGRGGLKGITPEAKRMVRSACVLMERLYGRGNCAFLTVTWPSDLTDAEVLLLNQNAGKILERIIQEIRRELERSGLLTHHIVGVIEMQLKRFLNHGQPCAHFHILFPARLPHSAWLVSIEKAQDICCRQIENVLGRAVDRKAMTQLAKAKKPLGNEMGKYLSKAAKVSKDMVALHPSFVPKSWVFIPQAFRAEIKAAIQVYQGEAVAVIADSLRDLQRAGILKTRPICVEVGDRQVTVGHVGFMRSGFLLSQFLCTCRTELLERIEFLTGRKLRRFSSAA